MECAIVNIMYQGFFREAEYLISINENTKKMPLFVFLVVFGGRESKKKKRGWEAGNVGTNAKFCSSRRNTSLKPTH